MRWLAILTLTLPAALGGQTLAVGRWHGVLSLPDAPVLVTVIANRAKERLTLEIRPEGGPAYGLGSIREDRRRIRFRWALGGGTEFECALSGREDGRVEGFCEDTVRGADGKFLKVPLALWRDPSPTP